MAVSVGVCRPLVCSPWSSTPNRSPVHFQRATTSLSRASLKPCRLRNEDVGRITPVDPRIAREEEYYKLWVSSGAAEERRRKDVGKVAAIREAVKNESVLIKRFERWMELNGCKYKDEEECQHRLAIYRQNLELIDFMNSKKYGFTCCDNMWADMMDEETQFNHGIIPGPLPEAFLKL